MTSAIRAQREAESGFTLIELLVVVIIIGILAAIAIPAFLNQRERAWESELTSTVRNVALEIESEATQDGGQYIGAGAAFADAAALNAFIQAELVSLQGDADANGVSDGPVTFTAGDASGTVNEYQICMEHTSLVTGNPAVADTRVVYDSDAGGLGEVTELACGAVAP